MEKRVNSLLSKIKNKQEEEPEDNMDPIEIRPNISEQDLELGRIILKKVKLLEKEGDYKKSLLFVNAYINLIETGVLNIAINDSDPISEKKSKEFAINNHETIRAIQRKIVELGFERFVENKVYTNQSNPLKYDKLNWTALRLHSFSDKKVMLTFIFNTSNDFINISVSTYDEDYFNKRIGHQPSSQIPNINEIFTPEIEAEILKWKKIAEDELSK